MPKITKLTLENGAEFIFEISRLGIRNCWSAGINEWHKEEEEQNPYFAKRGLFVAALEKHHGKTMKIADRIKLFETLHDEYETEVVEELFTILESELVKFIEEEQEKEKQKKKTATIA